MSKMKVKSTFSTCTTDCSPATNDQNCSFFDKSMKLCQITNIPVTNIFRYGASLNKLPELHAAHVLNHHCIKTRLTQIIVFCGVVSIYRYRFDIES